MKVVGKRSVSTLLTGFISAGVYTVAVVLVLMLGLASVSFFIDLSHTSNTEMSIPVSFSVEPGVLRLTAPAPGFATADIRDAHGTLRFPPPSRRFLTTTALLAALALAVVLWVLIQLRAVFRTLRDGRPFVTANAMRVRWIGYAVILGEVVRSLVLFGGNAYAKTHYAADALRFDAWPRIDVFSIVHGLIILVIAEVFRTGARLDEDQSLTI
ncbi:MAG TPA: DUF2975 domain-containing protein [Vicinamibacterales bacterium]|nr:DUF2975 domain-containing protein [Vicinamibacterales bacterium]